MGAKNHLARSSSTIPQKELEAAVFTIAHAEKLEKSLGSLIKRKVLIVDSSCVLSWIGAGLDCPSRIIYATRRVKLLIEAYGDQCYWTSTDTNPSDCGTRVDPGAEQIAHNSTFLNGPP